MKGKITSYSALSSSMERRKEEEKEEEDGEEEEEEIFVLKGESLEIVCVVSPGMRMFVQAEILSGLLVS
jgi:hypothetical protein